MTSNFIQGKLWILGHSFPFSVSTLLTKCELWQKMGRTVRVEINSDRGQNWKSSILWLNTQITALVGNKNKKNWKIKEKRFFMKQTLYFKLHWICTVPAIISQITWDLSTTVTGYILHLHISGNHLSWVELGMQRLRQWRRLSLILKTANSIPSEFKTIFVF